MPIHNVDKSNEIQRIVRKWQIYNSFINKNLSPSWLTKIRRPLMEIRAQFGQRLWNTVYHKTVLRIRIRMFLGKQTCFFFLVAHCLIFSQAGEGGMHMAGRGMHVHPVHPPWVRHWRQGVDDSPESVCFSWGVLGPRCWGAPVRLLCPGATSSHEINSQHYGQCQLRAGDISSLLPFSSRIIRACGSLARLDQHES